MNALPKIRTFCLLRPQLPRLVAMAALLALGSAAKARVIDNFDDNTKTDWTDFNFSAPFGLPTETGGQFRFEQPPAGRAFFSASRKISDLLELKEGRTLELRVDLVLGGAKDSFAVLAFIPQANDLSTLAGYGVAKSTTDFLITKGVNKYFYNENPATPVKNDNTTLVLNLTVRGGSVYIHAKVLDRDAGDAVIFEQTAVDTPGVDVLKNGDDTPAAPYITKGHFSLFLYQDYAANAEENPYQAHFDNAEVFETDFQVLDDFNDNTKTGWEDFNFDAPFGKPTETGGQFRFEQPPAGQPFFSASRKTSKLFELKEGERLRFQVDLVQGGGKDSFAVLAFIPEANGSDTLAGYGFSKSTTDLLISKGINKYFFNEDPATAVKQDNITLSLTLTTRNGSVGIEADVLDKDAGEAVIFHQAALDTPAADVLRNGLDSPAAPYITKGHFVLFLYQDYDAGAPEDPYQAIYDNAVVYAAPAALNTAPIITDFTPVPSSNFLPANTVVSFKVTDDQAIVDNLVSVNLNGTVFTTANGLVLTGAGVTKTATLSGQTVADVNYSAMVSAQDGAGGTVSQTFYFDTFGSNTLITEVEDYNFDQGSSINTPVLIAEGSGPQPDAYSGQAGVLGVDFEETRGSPNGTNTMYRPSDPIRMQHSLDHARAKFVNAGGSANGIYDYDVGDFAAGEWMNYTRTFPAGSYEVYLRQAQANMATSESVLERVTSDPSLPNQIVQVLGSFHGALTGFTYRNIPLTDAAGQNKSVLVLGGPTTLRIRHVTATPGDAARSQNYLAFVKVSNVGPQVATISSLAPAPNETVESVTPRIRVEILNRDTSVVISSITLSINGVLAPGAVVTPTATGAEVIYDYVFPNLPPSGTPLNASVAFRDNQNTNLGANWQFTFTYRSLNPAFRSMTPGRDRGFQGRVVQAPAGSGLENSLTRAEDQLRSNSPFVATVDFTGAAEIINYNKSPGGAGGFFPDDLAVPGLTDDNGYDDFVYEARCWLELKKGIYRFGVVTDDGYKITAGATPGDSSPTALLAAHNGGPANETVNFVVPEDGLYPFRYLWYERGGAAHAEWFSVNRATDERVLINDPSNPEAVRAWQGLALVTAEVSQNLISWLPAANATHDDIAKTVLIPRTQPVEFYRLRNSAPGAGAPLIRVFSLQGPNVFIDYDLP